MLKKSDLLLPQSKLKLKVVPISNHTYNDALDNDNIVQSHFDQQLKIEIENDFNNQKEILSPSKYSNTKLSVTSELHTLSQKTSLLFVIALHHICSFLEFNDILHISMTCKKAKEYICTCPIRTQNDIYLCKFEKIYFYTQCVSMSLFVKIISLPTFPMELESAILHVNKRGDSMTRKELLLFIQYISGWNHVNKSNIAALHPQSKKSKHHKKDKKPLISNANANTSTDAYIQNKLIYIESMRLYFDHSIETLDISNCLHVLKVSPICQNLRDLNLAGMLQYVYVSWGIRLCLY